MKDRISSSADEQLRAKRGDATSREFKSMFRNRKTPVIKVSSSQIVIANDHEYFAKKRTSWSGTVGKCTRYGQVAAAAVAGGVE